MKTKTLSYAHCALVASAVALLHSTALPAADLKFKLHTINTNSLYSSSAAFDVDKDGHVDIFCGGYWYAGPDFEKRHFVREVEMIGRGVPRADGYSHLVMDVNRDGWLDVIHVNFRSSSIYWLENPATSPGEWQKHMVDEPGQMETGRLYDVDGDGQMDVVPSPWAFSAWWELLPVSPGEPPKFARHEIAKEGGGHGSGFGDINGDGRGDYVGTQGWAEGPEDPRNGKWIWPHFDAHHCRGPGRGWGQ